MNSVHDVKAGEMVRFDDLHGTERVGYVTSKDELTGTLRVCVAAGKYYTVDRATATIV